MRLVALLSARAPASGVSAGGATAGEIRIGVHSPVEHQARQAIAAGAQQILIRSSEPGPQLARAIDGLTRESGIPILIVDDGPELGRRIELNDRVLMLAEQMILPQQNLDELIATAAPALLVTPTQEPTAHFERIDAQHVWAGAALLPGSVLLAIGILSSRCCAGRCNKAQSG
jgi:hypothetical protein